MRRAALRIIFRAGALFLERRSSRAHIETR